MKQGCLITFEGIEGCGKSTQIKLVSDHLSARGIDHYCTKEPGGTEIGSQIRKILLSERSVTLAPLSEALLYLADRLQHVTELIRPRLESGQIVLCDRFHDSTLAYQGYARDISLDWLNQIWQGSGISVTPDLTLLLDVEAEVGIKRSLQKLRRLNLDEARFENEKIDFHQRVREGFLALARSDPERFVIIDSGGRIEETHQSVIQNLRGRLASKIGYEIF